MDLAIESAFSTGGLVGRLSYLLLISSMLMRRLGPLRLLVIFSAMVAILYYMVWLTDPVSVFGETLLVLVNVGQLLLAAQANRRARFNPEEQAFIAARLPGLNNGEARRLLGRGLWLDGEAGRRLTTEGEPVSHLVWLSSGEAEFSYGGRVFGRCRPGNFIGEMSVVEEGPASADAALSKPSRLWMISGAAFRRLWRDEPALAAALEKAFSLDWREKLVAHRPEAELGAKPESA